MTSQSIAEARARLLAPNDLDEGKLLNLLLGTLGPRIDHADLYFQHGYQESWSLEDGMVKRGSFGVVQGVGARAVSGERSALAFSDDLSMLSISRATETTRAVSRETRDGMIGSATARPQLRSPGSLYLADNPILSLDAAGKIALLEKVDRLARARDPRVTRVFASLAADHDTVLIVRHDGQVVADVRPLVRLSIQIVVESNGHRESAGGGGGGRMGLDMFDDALLASYVDRAVDAALVKLEAVPAPAGMMTVVCGPGWPAVLLHEAVGHGLEGDFARKGTTAFAGRIGEQVAARGVTIVDDGTLPGRRGSLTVDDEGCPTQCTPLIEDGVLKGFMQDSLSARMTGVAPTGNGRRQSYAHPPLPRMTNTYMLNGNRDPAEILASVKNGIYAVDFAGGQVDITSGRFTFAATEAYLIENGRITAPVKGATLIGNGPESLKYVSMIGNDLELDRGIAMCGKEGQGVPVGVGQPTLRIDNMTVGGTA